MNTAEIKDWAANLKEDDEPGLDWPDAETLLRHIQRNWDFPGTLEDAQAILAEMAVQPPLGGCPAEFKSDIPREME